jgi:conjugal transfer pilus assembly protein TraV
VRTTAIRMAAAIAAGATSLFLGGCASSLTGVGGTELFACQAPTGAQCTSISGVYANARMLAGPPVHQGTSLARTPEVHRLREQHRNALYPLSQGFASSARPTPPGPLPGAPLTEAALPKPRALSDSDSDPGAGTNTPPSPASLRAPPRVVRLWIAPWEDSDGDLHEASLVHVVVDTGRWLIERVRPAARSRLDLARPPVGQAMPPAPGTGAKPPADTSATEP